MKMFNVRLLALVCAVLVLPALASAASDMFLKLTGVKGEAKIVQCPGGVGVVDGLAPGKYTVQVCDAKGTVIPMDILLEYSVKSPRDVATGQASGRRQHTPIRVSKATSATPTNEIAIDEPGVQISIQVAGGADARAQDHNSSRSNKTNN